MTISEDASTSVNAGLAGAMQSADQGAAAVPQGLGSGYASADES